MSWHTSPFAVYDLETTGPDPETARIVTACVAVVNAGPVNPSRWLADPGVDIPAEATAIHGITTEHAREHGQPADAVVDAVHYALTAAWAAGMPVIGYNVSYDLTVLDRELHRHGKTGIGEVGPVIDPLVLDRGLDRYRRGKRTLTAACQHYGVKLDGAHDASFDALAAGRVAWRIGQMYPHVAEMPLADLMAYQAELHRVWAAGFQDYLRRSGSSEVIDTSWPLRAAVAVG